MKTIVFALLAWFVCSQSAPAAEEQEKAGAAEKKLLVKVVDRSDKVSFELMSPADFQELQKQIAKENKLQAKALSAAEAAWREDEQTKKKPFPKSAISTKKADKLREFSDDTKASDALAAEEEKEAEKQKAEKDKQTAKNKAALERKTRTQAQLDKEKKRDEERDSLYFAAQNIYETKLQDLMAQAEGGGAQEKEEPKEKEADNKKGK
jgi:hypothetical protein